MKIFLDWMHRKLQPTGIKYSQVHQKKGQEAEERIEMVAEEKEALLLHDMLGGILTIGTLGQYRDPFLPSLTFEEEEKEEEEKSPLIVVEEEKEEDKATITLEKQEIIVEIETKQLQEDLPLLKEDKESRERVRTTLADLFAADPATREDANVDKGIKNTSNDSNKQSNKMEKKKKMKDTIKSCTNGKNNSSNINRDSNNKLHKLMTRMLKKKIHPESITSAETPAAAIKNMNKDDDVIKTGLVY
ncbi:protein TILLER ANGLE CONTROL 1-like [Zingiber officinale]|uniref:protein TILLER ANGLE CONTROL 1-like n=1 Tax=Zingiber officinale TaxID=94328 RepID=UPI001C4BE289|nr:protein TILLER ANGLE CONTROL 1-like [Zingiber officinale]